MFSTTQMAPPSDGNLGPLPPSQLTDQEVEERELQAEQNDSDRVPVATHTSTIGMIHPPPDIRTIVDKTAEFVSKNGLEFEKRIIANNAKNDRFNFFKSSDQYHAYYQHKLSEFRASASSSSQEGAQGTDSNAADATDVNPDVSAAADGAEGNAQSDS